MTSEQLAAAAQRYGTPCYVYDFDRIAERARHLALAFGNRFRLSYAVKSNPNRRLLAEMRRVVGLLDVSSAGELNRSLAAGWMPGETSFTGPGKTDSELASALDRRIGFVVVESVDEAQRLSRLAGARQVLQPVLIRISPARIPRGFGVTMAGKPTPFGIDEEAMAGAIETIANLDHLKLVGFHCYSGTQCLNEDGIVENFEIYIDIFRRAIAMCGLDVETLVFGAGMGIPYHERDRPLDIDAIGERVVPRLDRLKDEVAPSSDLILELGRSLVGEAGYYLVKILHIKASRGVDIAICDGGMHHSQAACGLFGAIVHRNYRLFKVTPRREEAMQRYDLCGPLCTTLDRLANAVELPNLAPGDVVAVEAVGAYGLSASPVHFISRQAPKEILAVASELKDISDWPESTTESVEWT